MSSSSANTSSGGSSSLPRLGPAWYRGAGNQGGRGFQPPPPVPAERSRARSGSLVSDHSNDSQPSSRQQNKFSVLGDDDDNNNGGTSTAAAPVSNSRSEALRTADTRRSGKPPGRSLADLAARAPPRESSGYRKHGGEDGGGRFSGLKGDEGKVIRYTREKLLSMRPPPKSEAPQGLKHLEGTPILSNVPQDPVCWDTFDADEIWAQAARDRGLRGSTKAPSAGPGTSLSALAERSESRRASTGSVTGRWQRGVALPPPDETRGRSMSRGSEGDLWDDPVGGSTGAAADFSAFGAIPDDPKKAFDFSEMAEASKRFEEELHGSSKSEGGNSEADDLQTQTTHSVSVDPRRPLAAAGTTIRSGSGEDVNVFEDFDEESAEGAKAESASEPAVKSAGEDPSASSRLMKMIGVETTKDTGTASAWGAATDSTETQNANTTTLPSSIPSNPWGDPIIPGGTSTSQQPEQLNLSARLEAAVAEQKAREAHAAAEMEQRRHQESELMRRREEEEAKHRAARLAQQEQQARQQAAMQQQPGGGSGGHSQVELVLMERICSILENSWGRSDLMSILSTLHSEDSRVIPLLGNIDALRALIARHPQRIGLRQDPSVGSEMAVILLTNAQWQQYQQAQAARAEQEELQRRQQQERLEAMRRAQAEAKEREAAAAAQPIVPDAPWFYADPQNNIQGPFKGLEMRQWLDAGYFKGDLPISQQPSGPFRSLSVVFPDLGTAFQVQDSSPSAEDEETKARAEEELRARKEAEEKLRAEAAEAEAAAQRQREEAEAAAAKAAAEQNQSSSQLKMMLGLGEGSSQQEPETGVPTEVVTLEEAAPKRSSTQQTEKRSSSKQTSKAAKAQQRSEAKKAATANAPSPSVKPLPAAPAAPASTPSAWGGAASAAPRKKSMSEIQQEEARRAAILAMERKAAPRQSSGGWANIAASGGGSTGWSSGAVKPLPPAVVTNPNGPTSNARAQQQPTQAATAQRQMAQKQATATAQQQGKSSNDNAFGAEGRMSPSLESWCKEQMRKLNGSDDLTLVSFCMTLNDAEEIRQYFTTYLGATSQVNSFANEFINRKSGKNLQDEWETPANAKKGRKKKGGTK